MLLMEEILRVYRVVNPASTVPQSISSTNVHKDGKVTSPTAVDAQELSHTLVQNMNRALNCITNAKQSPLNGTVFHFLFNFIRHDDTMTFVRQF
uniref:Uncharacterized protein n=1 Tax=Angiostrongylus cantonensis TaxID=6313 RepID=A0A0K0DL47_ANGCA